MAGKKSDEEIEVEVQDSGTMSSGSIPELGFEKDLKRETEGDWFTLDDVQSDYEHLRGIVKRVKVRSRYTPEYRRAELKMQTKALRKKDEQRILFGISETERMTAKYCLIDWEIVDKNGNSVAFTEERALQFMTDRRYRELAAFVTECIAILQGDLEEVREETEGKS